MPASTLIIFINKSHQHWCVSPKLKHTVNERGFGHRVISAITASLFRYGVRKSYGSIEEELQGVRDIHLDRMCCALVPETN